MRLTACTRCTRLVRRADAACPFCGTAVTHPPVVAASGPPRRLHRAALLGAAAVAAACGGSEVPQPAYGAPLYGGVFVDSGADASDAGADAADAAKDATPDAVMGAYGLPPMDAGQE